MIKKISQKRKSEIMKGIRRSMFEDNSGIDIANVSGVYRILNKENGMMYIGYTTAPFLKRWGTHMSDLMAHYHSNRKLRDDWLSFGYKAFSFEVIEVLQSNHAEMEKYWIAKMGMRTYNLTNPEKRLLDLRNALRRKIDRLVKRDEQETKSETTEA